MLIFALFDLYDFSQTFVLDFIKCLMVISALYWINTFVNLPSLHLQGSCKYSDNTTQYIKSPTLFSILRLTSQEIYFKVMMNRYPRMIKDRWPQFLHLIRPNNNGFMSCGDWINHIVWVEAHEHVQTNLHIHTHTDIYTLQILFTSLKQ